MGKTFSGHSFSSGHKQQGSKGHQRNQDMAELLAIAETVKTPPEKEEVDLQSSLSNLFNGVLGKYYIYGLTGELRTFIPKDPRKCPYPMLFIEDWARGHTIGDILNRAMEDGHSFGIPLGELRPHPDEIDWWAPTITTLNGKKALAYFLHSKEVFVKVATAWWQEYHRKEAEVHAKKQAQETDVKIEALRIETIRQGLRTQFTALSTSEDAKKLLVRYVPNVRFALVDENGAAIYFSTDNQKIYVEEIDPDHPLAKLNLVGIFINKAAALKNPEDPTLYDKMTDKEIAKRAYLLREYLRNHPFVAPVLPQAKQVQDEEGTTSTNVIPIRQNGGNAQSGKDQDCAGSIAAA